MPSGSGRCSFSASFGGAVIQIDLFGCRQDHPHRLGMDRPDLGIRLGCQECVEVVGGLAFLDLPDRCPVGPGAGEAGGAAIIACEPDVAALCLEFAERVKGHHATVFGAEPAPAPWRAPARRRRCVRHAGLLWGNLNSINRLADVRQRPLKRPYFERLKASPRTVR
jgi:hypothetical protein